MYFKWLKDGRNPGCKIDTLTCTGMEHSLPPYQTRKLDKIHETTDFRQWITGSAEL